MQHIFYQAVNEENSLPIGSFSDAITTAIEDNVDILNISAGDPWPARVEANPAVTEIKRALEEDITVVASAGNYNPEEQESKPPVHCPSAYDPVISVGGLVVNCPIEPGEEPEQIDDDSIGPYYVLRDDEYDDEYSPYNEVYCGGNGCIDGKSCITSQKDDAWDFNPLPTGNKPDVLAPMHVLFQNNENSPSQLSSKFDAEEEEFVIKSGTSFAAPLVSASLANIFAEIKELNEEIPLPHKVREAVRAGGAAVDRGAQLKYDGIGTRKALNVT